MKLLTFVPLLFACPTSSFVPLSWHRHHAPTVVRATASDVDSMAESKLDEIASKLKLQCYDVDTGVYGFESKDRLYGIENIHTKVKVDKYGHLGITLMEVAHSSLDHRGLVLVSKVDDHTLHETPVRVGDTIIGVFTDSGFRESTTGLDFDETVDVIERAKDNMSDGSLTLELNRVVKRAAVKVEIVDVDAKTTITIDALAGDNLRSLLMKHQARLYDGKTPRLDAPQRTDDCGGEGICGTCLVQVLEGMPHLNKIGPQEQTIHQGHHSPESWRAACKTVVGADNQEGTTLRVRLRPELHASDKLHP